MRPLTNPIGWAPDPRHGPRQTDVLLFVAALVTTAGCSDAEPPPTSNAPVTPPRVPSGLVLPTVTEAELPEAATDEALARRFAVPHDASRRYAVGVARDKGHLGPDARVCASWQRVSRDNTLLATEHVVGTGRECESWHALLEWARDAAPVESAVEELQRTSAPRFFTVAVSPYSFRHPLYEAHAGLPAWALRAARSAADSVPWRCEPRFVRGKAEKLDPELAGYECAEGAVTFDHLTAQPVEGTTLSARAEALAGFRTWQRAIARQYPGATAARIERLEGLWRRYDEEVAQ